MLKLAILGLGDRGMKYGHLVQIGTDAQITAICDKDPERIRLARERFGLSEAQAYQGAESFFAAGKIADAVFICTQDRDHYGHTKEALNLGYHIMVEKPVSPNPEHLREIQALAAEKNRKVVVCHVLRYSGFYQKINEILKSGAIGRPVLIRHSENIGYWHYIHSYVRGHWHKEEETSPLLMAKCCHDMDLLYWLAGSAFDSVYSQGGLTFYKPENAPKNASGRCCTCRLHDSCIYDARLQYLGREDHPAPKFPWGTYAVSNLPEREEIEKALETSHYGTCVFAGDNNVVDYQTVEITFQNGIRAQFSVNAFSNENYRKTHISGTLGELISNDHDETILFHRFGDEPKTFRLISDLTEENGGGHVGGDMGLVQDAVSLFEGKATVQSSLTLIGETLESHLIVDACEHSRKENRVIFRDK